MTIGVIVVLLVIAFLVGVAVVQDLKDAQAKERFVRRQFCVRHGGDCDCLTPDECNWEPRL